MNKQIDPIDDKFIESYEIDEWEIETENGWEDITHLHKTVKYDVYELRTSSFSLKCADTHIIITEGFKQKFVKDLTLDDRVITKNGLEKVIFVKKLDISAEHMYDLSINSKNHTFFTNNILSHNSTVSTIFLLWYALFNRDKTICIIANKESIAIEILDRIKMAYRLLPLWMQTGINDGGWNAKSISLGNGSRLIAAGTSTDSISGLSVSLLFIDEFAKIQKHVAEDFITATYPVISSGKNSKIIMISTPLGMNHFYEFWSKAVKGQSNFYPIKVGWWEVPGRDQQWKKEIIADIGKVRFSQEYQCKFLGSNSLLIDSDVLEVMDFKEPIGNKWNGLFLIYEYPIDGAYYVLGVDTAKGTKRDYSVIQVLKIVNEETIEQVAIYRNNEISPRDFSQVVMSVSQYYNDANMMIENNDIGQAVCDSIWYDFECERLINLDPKGIGVRSTKATKLEANMLLKDYMERNYIKIVDQRTIYELSRYEEVSPNVFRAENENDDTITAILWGLYFVKSDFYEGRTYGNTQIEDKFKIKDEEYDTPLMIFDE